MKSSEMPLMLDKTRKPLFPQLETKDKTIEGDLLVKSKIFKKVA